MMGFLQIARWMSRRNGRALAQAVAAVFRQAGERPTSGGRMQFWREVLESRPGWRQVNPNLFEFRTGDRMTLSSELSSTELLVRLTTIEVKPLGEGLPPAAQKLLCTDAVEAATAWWQRHGGEGT